MAEVFGGSQPTVPVRVKAALGVTINPDLRGEMKVALRYQGPLRAPIAEGAQVGSLVISVPTKPDTIVPVYAAQAVSRSGIFGKILIGIRALLGKA